MSTKRIKYLFRDKDVEIRPYIQGFKHGSTNYDENYVVHEINALDGMGYIFWSAVGKYLPVSKALYLLKNKVKYRSKNNSIDQKKSQKKDKIIDDVMNNIIKENNK